MLLKDILTTSSTHIQEITMANRGGTYMRFVLLAIHVPGNIKREWNCAWFKLHGDSFKNDPKNTYQVLEIIFPESPFSFLKNKLECDVEIFRSYMNGEIKEWDRVSFEGFLFQTDLRSAKPTPEAKRVFLNFLLHVSNLDINHKNIQFIETCRASNNPKLQEAAAQFHVHTDLHDFYKERIGDVLSIEDLSMERLYLTEYEVMTKDFSTARFSMPATEDQKNALLAHFNG